MLGLAVLNANFVLCNLVDEGGARELIQREIPAGSGRASLAWGGGGFVSVEVDLVAPSFACRQ